MNTIYIAHGYRSKRHVEWVENARSRFEAAGCTVQPVHYGFTRLWNVRRRTKDNANRLAVIAADGSIGIGHSNGCELLLRACMSGAKIKRLYFINPALKVDFAVPPGVESVEVFYASNDKAVVFGYYWRKLNPYTWFGDGPLWGRCGRVGYKGSDARVKNNALGPIGHSGALSWDYGPKIWDYIRSKELGEGAIW